MLHLHHLTPLNEAAARVAPDVPVVGHLHGTELLMLEAIEEDPERWAHAQAWAERMRGWAARCERLIVLSKSQDARAERLLGVPHEQCVEVTNGFDPSSSTRSRSTAAPSGPSTCPRWPATRARCCSTSGASPRSSASRC